MLFSFTRRARTTARVRRGVLGVTVALETTRTRITRIIRKRPDGQVRVERSLHRAIKPSMVWMEMSGALCIELDPEGSSPRSLVVVRVSA
jgi:hypothetical protein